MRLRVFNQVTGEIQDHQTTNEWREPLDPLVIALGLVPSLVGWIADARRNGRSMEITISEGTLP
jgi:hypothetical protein